MHKTIDGVRIAYDDAGAGDVLVFLHGFPFDRTIWDDVFATLARRVRVVRVDLRGSGESDDGVGPALMETLAGDVFGLLDALGIERAILAGHSMGGYVALAYFRMYAERVAGLALIASHAGADTPERAAARADLAQQVLAHGTAVLIEPALSSAFTSPFADDRIDAVQRVRAIVARQRAAGAAAQITGMKERVDSSDLLEDLAIPVSIVGGRADPLIAPAIFERTSAAIADCELTLLPHVAHLPMVEAPAATIAVLERLIARCA